MQLGGLHTTRRWIAATLLAAIVALALSACGGSSGSSTHAMSGKAIFSSAGCGGCHTLAAAGATGSIGPNLDTLKPSVAAVVKQVTNGGGGMPSFHGSLSKAQINTVAGFVASSAK